MIPSAVSAARRIFIHVRPIDLRRPFVRRPRARLRADKLASSLGERVASSGPSARDRTVRAADGSGRSSPVGGRSRTAREADMPWRAVRRQRVCRLSSPDRRVSKRFGPIRAALPATA